MKRLLFFAALILVTLTSCVSELDKTMVERDKGRIQKFYATIESEGPDTKVFADENMKVLWNADDRLSVFNKSTYNSQFRFAGDDGDNAGDFDEMSASGSGSALSNVYAVYPYSTGNTINTTGTAITLTLPAEQAYKIHSFGIGANTMVAATNSNFLAFKNVGGYLSLRLYGDDVFVRRITLQGRNHEKIAGKAEISVGVGTTPSVTMTNDATETISIVCDPPVTIGTSSSNYTDFWFVIPPVTFTKGFTVTVTDNLGGTFSVSTSSNFTISRSTVEWMAPLKVVPNYDNVNVVFADANFKDYCVQNFDSDHDGEVSVEEAQTVKKIDVNTNGISTLEGIAFFASLEELYCRGGVATKSVAGGGLTSLDLSYNKHLVKLDCSGNQIEVLDVSGNPELQVLCCTDNPLETVNLSEGQVIGSLEVPESTDILYDWEEPAQIVKEFPDPSFRVYVLDNFDKDHDGELSQAEKDAVTSIEVCTDTVVTVRGIECFANLQTLVCCGSNVGCGQLTSLDLSKNTLLARLWCNYNQLQNLDVTKNTQLTLLSCSYNQLSRLDLSNNTQLIEMDCHYNQLTSLDVTKNTSLEYLYCHSNQLTSLDVSKSTALIRLWCQVNQLASLDIANNTALNSLECDYNQLTSLDVRKNTALTFLSCSENQLTSLDVSTNTAMTDLWCDYNQLTSLDVSKNTELIRLHCVSNPHLTEIWLKTNQTISYFTYDSSVATIKYKDASGSEIISIPDASFKAYCVQNFDTDHNGEISFAEALTATRIDVCTDSIESLQGIEHFTNLQSLGCYGTETWDTSLQQYVIHGQLTGLDVSKNTALTSLSCYCNQLTSLDVSKNTALIELACSSNQLSILDVSKNTVLTKLVCHSNRLTSLDVSKNTALIGLYCHSNQLTSLDVSKNTALTSLACFNNQLTSLDVSRDTALTGLRCHFNQLTILDVSNNAALTTLWCDSNPSLTEIWLKTNQTIDNFSYDTSVATIKYKDASGSEIVSIPDANFKAYCVQNYDKNDDGEISIAEAKDVTVISVNTDNIESVQGIELFPNLTRLVCRGYNAGQLKTLDLSNNSALTVLACGNNLLTNLDVSQNENLLSIGCNKNQLTKLDLTNNPELISLSCGNNQLTSLDLSENGKLETIYCYSNQISTLTMPTNQLVTIQELDCRANQFTNLDVSGHPITVLDARNNTNLASLSCNGCQMKELDISGSTALTSLSCDENSLAELDISTNILLQSLSCLKNQLEKLDVSTNTALDYLNCNSNQLTSLDVSKNTALDVLACGSNQLTSLDVSKNTVLTNLFCYSNQLTSLDVSRNTALTVLSCRTNPSLTEIWLKTNQTISTFLYDTSVATVKYKD